MAGRKRGKQGSSIASSRSGSSSPLRRISPNLVVGLVLLVAASVGLYCGWQRWGRAAVARANHRLTVDHLQITDPPPWIRRDVKGEVFRDGSLGELTFFDKQLTYKVYRAFEMHAWVAKVDRVGKRPSGEVVVDLHYRRPVAWVEIPADLSPLKQDSMLPIDRDAVLLPPEDLQEHAGDFLRISIARLPAWGLKGTPWRDSRLLGAARLAAQLEGCWRQLDLYRIRVLSAIDSKEQQRAIYELMTRSEQSIIWGSAPGKEASREPSAVEKVEWLKRLAAGSSLSNNGPLRIDLRVPDVIASDPRTAGLPGADY